MQLREKTRRHQRQLRLRARGAERSCMPAATHCDSSTTCRVNRELTYEKCARLESCSRDPIGYVDGASLYRSYFGSYGVDPSGMACSFLQTEGDWSNESIAAFGIVLGRSVSLDPGLREIGTVDTVLCVKEIKKTALFWCTGCGCDGDESFALRMNWVVSITYQADAPTGGFLYDGIYIPAPFQPWGNVVSGGIVLGLLQEPDLQLALRACKRQSEKSINPPAGNPDPELRKLDCDGSPI